MHNLHKMAFTDPRLHALLAYCEGTLTHFTLKCKKTQAERKWAKDHIYHLLNDTVYPCIGSTNEHLSPVRFNINYRGIIHNSESQFIKKGKLIEKWVDIQATLSLYVGKAYTEYWENLKT